MAKVKMCSVQIFAVNSERKELLEYLQALAAVDLQDQNECEDGFFRTDTSTQALSFERNAAAAEQALAIFDEYAPQKKGLLESLAGKDEITSSKFEEIKQSSVQTVQTCYDIIELNKRIIECEAERIRHIATISSLDSWKLLDVSMRFTGTKTTAAFIGSVPTLVGYEDLIVQLHQKNKEFVFDVEILSQIPDQTCMFFLCHRSQAQEFEQALREMGFMRPVHPTGQLPTEKIMQLEQKLHDLSEKIKKSKSEIEELAVNREQIKGTIDYYLVRSDKYRVISTLDQSNNTFIVKGYVPLDVSTALKKEIESRFSAACEISPANEDTAPVKLHNNSFVTPAETITEMYSLPLKRDIDPTPVMSFFYYFFFGLMLSDAGYGLLLVLGSWFMIKKLRPSEALKKNFQLFLYCGISTIFWGLMFGSFFGDAIPVISNAFFGADLELTPILFDPMEQAVLFLVMSLCFGFIQIMVGLGAKFYVEWKNGDKLGALFDTGFWMTMLMGFAMLAAGMLVFEPVKNVGIALSVISAAGIIVTGGRNKKGAMKFLSGIAGLYDITGYVSDLMSYSRLMALGLTTSAMSSVFNMLSVMGGKSFAGFIVLLIIFPITHAINFGLNALGAYVHTIRLQYVELFSKFYEGGGRPFSPFARNSKYVNIKEDIK